MIWPARLRIGEVLPIFESAAALRDACFVRVRMGLRGYFTIVRIKLNSFVGWVLARYALACPNLKAAAI